MARILLVAPGWCLATVESVPLQIFLIPSLEEETLGSCSAMQTWIPGKGLLHLGTLEAAVRRAAQNGLPGCSPEAGLQVLSQRPGKAGSLPQVPGQQKAAAQLSGANLIQRRS